MGRLKGALASHQHAAARNDAKKRAQAAQEAKKASVKASLDGIKKGKKRAKQSASVTGTTLAEGKSEKPKGKGKERPPTIPFDKQDTILLLGEANFSFSHSLLSAPHSHPPHLILATAFDTEEVTMEKYPDAKNHIAALREKGVMVEFGVDAGALEKCKAVGKGRRWSRVIFNFPHVGAGIKDQDRNVLTNQHLLLRFFRSIEPLLTEGPTHMPMPKYSTNKKGKKTKHNVKSKPQSEDESGPSGVSDQEDPEDYFMDDSSYLPLPKPSATKEFVPPKRAGTALVTLLTCPPYSLWCLPQLAARPPAVCPGTNLPQPRYALLRSFEFKPEIYEGYAHRRTIGWKEGLSKGENEEILGRKGIPRTYEFVINPSDERAE